MSRSRLKLNECLHLSQLNNRQVMSISSVMKVLDMLECDALESHSQHATIFLCRPTRS